MLAWLEGFELTPLLVGTHNLGCIFRVLGHNYTNLLSLTSNCDGNLIIWSLSGPGFMASVDVSPSISFHLFLQLAKILLGS